MQIYWKQILDKKYSTETQEETVPGIPVVRSCSLEKQKNLNWSHWLFYWLFTVTNWISFDEKCSKGVLLSVRLNNKKQSFI